MPCRKRKFSLDEAKKVLELALKSDDPERKEKRYYFCLSCSTNNKSYYHLTSISENKRDKIVKENEKDQNKRIRIEAEYYKNKKGWD